MSQSKGGADVKAVIERLLTHGDPTRTIICPEWLGNIFLSAFVGEMRNA